MGLRFGDVWGLLLRRFWGFGFRVRGLGLYRDKCSNNEDLNGHESSKLNGSYCRS